MLFHRLLVLYGCLYLSDSHNFLRPEPGVRARLLLQVVTAASMRGGASAGVLLLPLCRWTRWVPVRGEEILLSDVHIPSGPFAAATQNVTPGGATGRKSAVAFLALLKEENVTPQAGILSTMDSFWSLWPCLVLSILHHPLAASHWNPPSE